MDFSRVIDPYDDEYLGKKIKSGSKKLKNNKSVIIMETPDAKKKLFSESFSKQRLSSIKKGTPNKSNVSTAISSAIK